MLWRLVCHERLPTIAWDPCSEARLALQPSEVRRWMVPQISRRPQGMPASLQPPASAEFGSIDASDVQERDQLRIEYPVALISAAAGMAWPTARFRSFVCSQSCHIEDCHAAWSAIMHPPLVAYLSAPALVPIHRGNPCLGGPISFDAVALWRCESRSCWDAGHDRGMNKLSRQTGGTLSIARLPDPKVVSSKGLRHGT